MNTYPKYYYQDEGVYGFQMICAKSEKLHAYCRAIKSQTTGYFDFCCAQIREPAENMEAQGYHEISQEEYFENLKTVVSFFVNVEDKMRNL